MEEKIEIEHRLTAVEDRSKSNTKRLDKLELESKALTDMATSMKVMAERQEHIVEKQDEMADTVEKLDGKVEALEAKPGKRWETIVTEALKLIIAAFVGYLLAQIGLQ